jgi:hypothetical protein
MPDPFPNLNEPYRNRVQVVLRKDNDVLDDLITLYWTELAKSVRGAGLTDSDRGALVAKTLMGLPFSSGEFWRHATCAEAMASTIAALRDPMSLDDDLDPGLLDKATEAVGSPADVGTLQAFLEELAQAPDADRQSIGRLYLLATHMFAKLASMDSGARKRMSIKKGLFG